MGTDSTVEVEARTYSTLSSAVRLRASVAGNKVEDTAGDLLENTALQFGALLSRLARLDFNTVDQAVLSSVKDDLNRLHELIGSSLDSIRWILDSARKELGPEITETYEPFVATLTRDHQRLQSILGDLEMHFSDDFRRALKQAVQRTGPPEERFMDWRAGLASLSD